MKEENKIKERLENFLNSESGFATATKIILTIIGLAGMLAIAVTVPNIFQLAGSYKKGRRYSRRQIQYGFYSLKRRGFIKVSKKKDDKIIKLTNKGKNRVKEFSIETLTIANPKSWDKKWRAVIFDIPTKPKKYNKARGALRDKLRKLGFYRLQKSVWVYPFPCHDEILFIADFFGVKQFIEILTVDNMLHENKLKNFFGLN
jgi:DNA-binding transcriptional regulator PaaX